MTIPTVNWRRKRRAPSPFILPNELIPEILSFLSVKTVMQMRRVSKSWNTLISDPTFIKLHLKRSARNVHLTLFSEHFSGNSRYALFNPFPIQRLLENQLISLADDSYYRLKDKDFNEIVGSCNGLICLLGSSFTSEYPEFWFYFWNPAMRTISEKLGSFHNYIKGPCSTLRFAFGYDNSTCTFKVVSFRSGRSEVRVFSLSDNIWRDIQSFPVVPLQLHWNRSAVNDGVYLRGTLNWLAIRNGFIYDRKAITVEQFVIVSLDLGTEKYTQFMLPRGFDEVPHVAPTICVLMDCLCISHDFKGTDFVIWKMTQFGVEESWTQLFKISYQNLQFIHYYCSQLLPLGLSEKDDTLILTNELESQAILYNWRANRVERTRISYGKSWHFVKDYAESMVSTR